MAFASATATFTRELVHSLSAFLRDSTSIKSLSEAAVRAVLESTPAAELPPQFQALAKLGQRQQRKRAPDNDDDDGDARAKKSRN